ncbi:transposase domain-containing protein [Salmonella enterica subsp. diarizonae]|nr:transposase domain-containing protein [Salmonella enterica subsp. diarizonae]ECQ1027443.1 transposase domain-containing protein [Salmonella enterica subsp. diarizonae]EDE1925907.1 hypothetical protein [Salmonella enterica subsp. diarizonae]
MPVSVTGVNISKTGRYTILITGSFDYLMQVFSILPTLSANSDLTQLLPWNMTLPPAEHV